MTKPPKRTVKLSEADLQRLCTDFLALDGWRPLRTDPVSRREWGKGFGEKGMADYLYIRYGDPLLVARGWARILWIEWKSRKGKASPHQTLWHEHERKLGAKTLICGIDFPASFEGFERWYKESGLRIRV